MLPMISGSKSFRSLWAKFIVAALANDHSHPAEVEGSRCESSQITSRGSFDFAQDD